MNQQEVCGSGGFHTLRHSYTPHQYTQRGVRRSLTYTQNDLEWDNKQKHKNFSLKYLIDLSP